MQPATRSYAATSVPREQLARVGTGKEEVGKLELLMKDAGVDVDLSPAHQAALAKAEASGCPLAPWYSPTGRSSPARLRSSSVLPHRSAQRPQGRGMHAHCP